MKLIAIALCSSLLPVAAWAQDSCGTWTNVPIAGPSGSTWKYFKGATAAPPASWTSACFNDASWLSGPGGFGYGPDCVAQRGTTLSDMSGAYQSIYLRKVLKPVRIGNMMLDLAFIGLAILVSILMQVNRSVFF